MPQPCVVCGELMTERKVWVCERPHVLEGPRIGSAIQSCPVAMGSIWVHVADDAGKGIPTFNVSHPGEGDGKPTNGDGFSAFDPLKEGTAYSVTIGPVPNELADTYFPPKNPEALNIPVNKGEITSVEFRVERICKLKVTVREKDAEVFVKDVEVTLTGPTAETTVDPAKRPTLVDGTVLYPRLRKAPGYQAKIELLEVDRKKYTIDGADQLPCDVVPAGLNELTFRLIPMTWVNIQIKDKDAETIEDLEARKNAQPTGKIKVKKLDATVEEQPATRADIVEFFMKRQDGTFNLEQLEVDGDECYEFVTVTET